MADYRYNFIAAGCMHSPPAPVGRYTCPAPVLAAADSRSSIAGRTSSAAACCRS